jgi:WD40 repeat protein
MGGVNRDFTLISSSRLDGAVVLADLATGALRWSATPPVPPGADPTPAYHAFSPDSRLLATTTRGGALHIWDVATGTLLRTIATDFGNASPITFDPRGELVLVPSGQAVNLWEAATGRLRASISESQEPSDQYLCATVSGDGRLIATGDSRGTAAIWDAATLAPLRRLRGMKPVVWSVAFNPSGTRLAVGSQDRTTRVWDPATGEQLLVLRGHTGSVVSLAWSPDGSTLASGAYDGTVRLWHAAPAAPR